MPVITDTAPKPPRDKWLAGPDRIAHAHRAGRSRTLCGLHPIDERLAWPETFRCATCLNVAAIPEGVEVYSLDEFLDEIGARWHAPAFHDDLEAVS